MVNRIEAGAPRATDLPGLVVTDVTKAFGATVALNEVSLEVGAGRVHALLGSNGSGKSTLVKILAGVHQATGEGQIRVGELAVPASTISPASSASLGLRFVHQQLGLFPQLTIADNFAATAGFGGRSLSPINRHSLNRRTREMLAQFRIDADPEDRVDRLRPAVQTLVAIGRAMSDRDRAKVLVLDEPTEALPEDETSRLLTSIRNLAADGLTFVIVSHRLAEVAEVADEVTVLRDGNVVASGPTSQLSRADLVEHITGNRVAVPRRRQAVRVGAAPAVKVESLSVGPVRDLSFDVAPGEILGIAGLVGSGRSAILEGIFGARPLRGGQVTIGGRSQRFRHPGDAIRAGIGLVPESRTHQGLFLDRSVTENITAARVEKFRIRGSIRTSREQAHGRMRVAEFAIKSSSAQAPIATLSGGNQQKAILARWLDTSPALLLLDEPTRGVDVGARAEIHAVIGSAVEAGMAVIIVSSDLDELCDLSDRVIILRRGHATHMLDSGLTVGKVAALMHEAG
ncbi:MULTISPECIES: sugar ABC transporter ATP-binding protein [unclassified Nocardioides]|uniref:sugar ABC transporter ATP-binding protein n=1 Tax=unclassified Nocardioides TaxID=2615069 RepID=UPI000AA6072D|nr:MULTISPECIES: sugar ABC transporter ATP-binding protein [unclassified Nocardioides]